MNDILIGRVADVIGSESICLDVQIVSGHAGVYGSREQVRLNRGARSSQLGAMNCVSTVETLVHGNSVACLVYGRDMHGDLEADVYLLDEYGRIGS